MRSPWITVLSIVAICVTAVAFSTPTPACADSWPAPEAWSELSDCGDYRFTASPAPHDGYDPIDVNARPTGVLERRLSTGEWGEVWRESLVNEILPTSALVACNGAYVVTFDNWYSTGHGENVIVIYRADGSLVRSMQLADLIPETYIFSLSHSVSSVAWRHDQGIEPDGQTAFIDVYAPGQDWFNKDAVPLRFRIGLADGAITLPRADLWESALVTSRLITLETVRNTLEHNRMMRVPISAPVGCEVGPWDFYLGEVVQRMSPVGLGYKHVSIHVLGPEQDEEARRQFANFKGFAVDTRSRNNQMVVAAPCAAKELTRAASEIAQHITEGGVSSPLTMLTLYVSADRTQFDKVNAMLAESGAQVVWLNPKRTIPQRPDRFPDNDDEVAELRAFEAEILDQIDKGGDGTSVEN